MKKFLAAALSIFCFLSVLSGCVGQRNQERKLSDQDLTYIDAVYQNMDRWDVPQKDGSESYTIDKIAFYDFDGTNKICFYILYPITDIYGWGYFISKDGTMSAISGGDTERIINSGWIARTRGSGWNWDSTATAEQKYERLKSAYWRFLESNT